jgi:GGDEF domain-containing protein
LSLIVLQPTSGSIQSDVQKAVQEIQKNMMLRFLLTNLGQIISQEARRTDLILNQGKEGRFVVLCPETTSKGVLGLAERIRSTASDRLGLSLTYGIASFPDEALTFDDLLHKAERELIHLYTAQNFKMSAANSLPEPSENPDGS